MATASISSITVAVRRLSFIETVTIIVIIIIVVVITAIFVAVRIMVKMLRKIVTIVTVIRGRVAIERKSLM